MSGLCPVPMLGILWLPIQSTGRVRGWRELESEKPESWTVIYMLKWTKRQHNKKEWASNPAFFLDTKYIYKGNLEVHLLCYATAHTPSATCTSVQSIWICPLELCDMQLHFSRDRSCLVPVMLQATVVY